MASGDKLGPCSSARFRHPPLGVLHTLGIILVLGPHRPHLQGGGDGESSVA